MFSQQLAPARWSGWCGCTCSSCSFLRQLGLRARKCCGRPTSSSCTCSRQLDPHRIGRRHHHLPVAARFYGSSGLDRYGRVVSVPLVAARFYGSLAELPRPLLAGVLPVAARFHGSLISRTASHGAASGFSCFIASSAASRKRWCASAWWFLHSTTTSSSVVRRSPSASGRVW